MESQEVLDILNDSVTSHSDGLERMGSGMKESENLGVEFLEDFDSYWIDVNDRLTVSRMVSESVNRGIVCAVEQEAAEKLAAKELELEKLKGFLDLSYGRMNGIEFHNPESINKRQHLGLLDNHVELNKIRGTLGSFRYAIGEQFNRLKKEIDGVRGCNSIRKINSVSELVGLGGILNERENGSWVGVDRTIDSLGMTLDSMVRHVDDILNFSDTTSSELQQEQEFQRKVETMVMTTMVGSLQKEFERKMWEQNAKLHQSESVQLLEKFNEISNLRKELEVIVKLLGSHETGPLVSYGSGDVEHSHRKVLNNHVSFQTPHLEGNGNVDDPKSDVTEVFDASRFKHMSRDELEKHFTATMTSSKREHELIVQRVTEQYISLKGKYLKGSLPIKRDKEFDILKRKIPEVISKLDNIIVDNEKLPELCNNTLSSLKDGLDNLLLENHQLRDLLTDKNNEVRRLSSQVSDATEKMLQQSLSEKHCSNLVANVNSLMEDASIETFIVEEVYKCVLGELSCHISCNSQESEQKSVICDSAKGSKLTNNQCQIEDSDIELLIMHQTCELILMESLKDSTGQLKELHHEYFIEKNNQVSLEMEVSKLEKDLRLKVVENEKLQQEAVSMTALIEEKDIFAKELSLTLMKKNEKFEISAQELNDLREYTKQQDLELDLVKGKLKKALEQIEANELHINNLNKHIELQLCKLNEADELKKIHVALSEARQNDLSLLEATQRKQMDAIVRFSSAMSKQFTQLKCKVDADISLSNSRLICSKSHLNSLTEKARILREVGLQYKQKLQHRWSDLQMAEAEVDLLGDEVEKLLGLLEKIYIALDHYSPILQHYPGIIEILKMVRRELSGETSKSV